MYHDGDFTRQTPGRYVAPAPGGLFVEDPPIEEFSVGWPRSAGVPSRADPYAQPGAGRPPHPALWSHYPSHGTRVDHGMPITPTLPAGYRPEETILGIPRSARVLPEVAPASRHPFLLPPTSFPGASPHGGTKESYRASGDPFSFCSWPGLFAQQAGFGLPQGNGWMLLVIVLAVVMALVLKISAPPTAPLVLVVSGSGQPPASVSAAGQ